MQSNETARGCLNIPIPGDIEASCEADQQTGKSINEKLGSTDGNTGKPGSAFVAAGCPNRNPQRHPPNHHPADEIEEQNVNRSERDTGNGCIYGGSQRGREPGKPPP